MHLTSIVNLRFDGNCVVTLQMANGEPGRESVRQFYSYQHCMTEYE